MKSRLISFEDVEMSDVTRANELVRISFVCDRLGMRLPNLFDMGTGSIKTYCPFGDVNHADGGASRAFRIYPASNSAYCFEESEYYSPVKLWAIHRGVDFRSAARDLLILVGDRDTRDLDKRWSDLQSYRSPSGSPGELREALQVFCGVAIPSWSSLQFYDPWSSRLSGCLELLPFVHTEEDARLWLYRCKAFMVSSLALVD